MRVTSALWVSAYVRRCFVEGMTAAVSRKGSEEAGAIFVVVDRLDGTADLFGPAPQSAFDSTPSDRLFQRLMERVPPAEVAQRIEKERRFDPDVWVVDVEDKAGRSFLDLSKD
jgi:hypothetical protein